MINVKVLDRRYLTIKHQWLLEDVKFGIDIISDESYKLVVPYTTGIIKGDILQITLNKVDYFHVIDKIIRNELMYKNILELFNNDVRETNANITLYNFIADHFITDDDIERNFPWLDISEVFSTYKVKLDASGESNVYNAKTVITDTILGNRATYKMELIEYTTNVAIKLIVQPQTDIFYIRLSDYTLQNLVTPQINKAPNTCDVWLTKTREKTVTATDGSAVTTTEFVSLIQTRYYLLRDNTITTNKNNNKRITPPITSVIEQTYGQEDEVQPDPLALATAELLDTTNYYWSFDMLNERYIYTFDIAIGDLVDIGTDEGDFRSVCTGIEYNEGFTTYKFGFNRLDFIFEFNKLK